MSNLLYSHRLEEQQDSNFQGMVCRKGPLLNRGGPFLCSCSRPRRISISVRQQSVCLARVSGDPCSLRRCCGVAALTSSILAFELLGLLLLRGEPCIRSTMTEQPDTVPGQRAWPKSDRNTGYFRNGGPYQRGHSDYYYYRTCSPHYYTTGQFPERVPMRKMTKPQRDAYYAGWKDAEQHGERKRYD